MSVDLEAAADEVCASCGKAALDDVKLKKCACKIVKYCSIECQISSECMPQHLNELCRNDPTSSGRTHDATIVNFSSDIQSKNATHTNHLMLSYSFTLENISSGTLRFSAMVKCWACQATFIWLITQPVLFLKRGKLKLTSTTGDTAISYGHQTVGRLMGRNGFQYYINRTNHGTNRRGVTNECRPHVDTDSIK